MLLLMQPAREWAKRMQKPQHAHRALPLWQPDTIADLLLILWQLRVRSLFPETFQNYESVTALCICLFSPFAFAEYTCASLPHCLVVCIPRSALWLVLLGNAAHGRALLHGLTMRVSTSLMAGAQAAGGAAGAQ